MSGWPEEQVKEVEMGTVESQVKWVAEHIGKVQTGARMKRAVEAMGLRYPAGLTWMYLNGEASEYLAAAVLAVNQVGA